MESLLQTMKTSLQTMETSLRTIETLLRRMETLLRIFGRSIRRYPIDRDLWCNRAPNVRRMRANGTEVLSQWAWCEKRHNDAKNFRHP